MSPTTTSKSRPAVQSGPRRLPITDAAPPSKGRALLALLGSAVLIAGVPVALVLLVGNPLPTTAPSRSWLTADVNGEVVINVVAVLVWIVWAHFVVCFLTEWRALRRGRMPGHVLFGGGSQTVARQLVATILLLSGGASIAHGLTAHQHVADTAAPTTTSRVASDTAAAAVTGADDVAPQAESVASTAGHELKMLTVKVPDGRHHDTLWGIAERTLGNPLRYKEIFELNKDRLQADGRRLVDADLIQPGWQLRLPADASGPDVHALSTPKTLPPGGLIGDDTADAVGGNHVAPSGDMAGPTLTDASRTSRDLDDLLLGGGLVLAGIVAALRARRGPLGAPDADVLEMAAAANTRRAEFVDLALRALAENRRSHDEPLPDVRFVYVDDDQIVLHLVEEAGRPDAPWRSAEDGLSWTLRREEFVAPAADAPAPYPALVAIATTHGFDVLVDLEVAPGLVVLGGDGAVSRDLATAMAVDLTTHAWSDGVQVYMVGFGENFVDLDDRVHQVADLEQVFAGARDRERVQSAVLRELGVQGVLQGRTRAPADCEPTVVFLSAPPTSEEAQRLNALAGSGRTAFSAVCVGDSPSARWRMVVDGAGRLEMAALGITGEARRLDLPAQRRLREMLERARADRAAAAGVIEREDAAAVAADSAVGSVAAAGAPTFAEAAVRLHLLGPVELEAPGPVEDDRRAALTELVTLCALHPDGLHRNVLVAAMWPRGVEDDVVDARIADAAAWLGTDAGGVPRLRTGDDGILRLGDDVATDYGVLVDAAAARGAGGRDQIMAALGLGTGAVFSGAGDAYEWFTFAREARQCRLLVAVLAQRAARSALDGARPDRAEEALELGLRLVPDAEVLWRALLRLVAQREPARVPATISRMYSAPGMRGGRHEPETDALVAELAPGSGGRASGS